MDFGALMWLSLGSTDHNFRHSEIDLCFAFYVFNIHSGLSKMIRCVTYHSFARVVCHWYLTDWNKNEF